jgi:membrane fusion protein (multidrug efflux system)
VKLSCVQLLLGALIALSLSACSQATANGKPAPTKVTVATVQARPVTLTQAFVAQIKAHRHVDIRLPENGYVKAVLVRAGQAVKKDDVLFKATSKSAIAEGEPQDDIGVVPIRAPFDGVVSGPLAHTGSLVKKGGTLGTLSDNSVVWVYFNVPETHYLDFMSADKEVRENLHFELVLANGKKFNQLGKLGAIGTHFNEETGSVSFRADFSNPESTLVNDQTGTLIFSRDLQDAVVVPQQATLEIEEHRYVFFVDNDKVVHQREIVVQQEVDDLFVVETGIVAGDKVVVEGVGLIQDGDKVQIEER